MMKHYPCPLWWVANLSMERLPSGRWRVIAWNVQADATVVPGQRFKVYAPARLETEHSVMCWATHTPTFQRLKVRSQGSEIMSRLKKKYPEVALRKELFTRLNQQLNDEFFTGWLYADQDAQDILLRKVFGYTTAELIPMHYPKNIAKEVSNEL